MTDLSFSMLEKAVKELEHVVPGGSVSNCIFLSLDWFFLFENIVRYNSLQKEGESITGYISRQALKFRGFDVCFDSSLKSGTVIMKDKEAK